MYNITPTTPGSLPKAAPHISEQSRDRNSLRSSVSHGIGVLQPGSSRIGIYESAHCREKASSFVETPRREKTMDSESLAAQARMVMAAKKEGMLTSEDFEELLDEEGQQNLAEPSQDRHDNEPVTVMVRAAGSDETDSLGLQSREKEEDAATVQVRLRAERSLSRDLKVHVRLKASQNPLDRKDELRETALNEVSESLKQIDFANVSDWVFNEMQRLYLQYMGDSESVAVSATRGSGEARDLQMLHRKLLEAAGKLEELRTREGSTQLKEARLTVTEQLDQVLRDEAEKIWSKISGLQKRLDH